MRRYGTWAACGLVAVAVVAAVVLVLTSKPAPEPAKAPKAVPRAKPSAVPKAPLPETNTVATTPKVEKLEPGTKRHVVWKRPDNWDSLTRAQKTRAQPVGRVIRPKGMDEKKLFTQISDQKIHRLLRVKPGQLFLGTATYDGRFVKTFLESLKEPIEFADDDTPEEREMKQAVIDTRKELKEAYDRGEDIAELMRETERQMHEQAAYRLDLRRAIVEYKKSGEHTDQDIKDYITAANSILNEHGMEPLKLGNFWFHKALMDSQTEEQ